MSEEKDEELIPMFMPKLGLLLCALEKKKGAPLIEEEVLEATDKAACIMMAKSDYDKLPREFADVNPQNPWVDWHRVRPQYMGAELPGFVFSVPCKKDDTDKIVALFEERQYEVEVGERNAQATIKYAKCASTLRPQIDKAELDLVVSHEVFITAYGPHFIADLALNYALNGLNLVGHLIDAGALAVYCDSDYQTHSRAVWQMLVEHLHGADAETNESDADALRAIALIQAFMQPRLKEDNDYLTCGLHLLGVPDLIVDADMLKAATGDGANLDGQAQELFQTLAIYLLTEGREKGFYNRHTFSMDESSPRFRLIWEACTYPDYSMLFNPFGRWRLHHIE